VLDDETPGPWVRGGASRWWLHHSLTALVSDLTALGVPLVLRRGPAREVVPQVAHASRATLVVAARGYEPWADALERDLKAQLAADGVDFKRYAGHLLFEPDAVRNKAGEPFKVYSPFWRCVSQLDVRAPEPAPTSLRAVTTKIASDLLADWALLPTKPDWASGFEPEWTPGAAGAEQRLHQFLDAAVHDYATRRNEPGVQGTSRLSPHLHFGEISPATCWHAALARSGGRMTKGVETFLKEIVWREFAYHLIHQFPDLPSKPFRSEFARFPWSPNAKLLRAWQTGRTGYPIVDAGMRELWQTGWMHNRVRMIVASFLIKDLLIPWQQGEAWFWDCLVDADIANNAASWQWVAGCGADAAPYFRIFNPVKQGQQYDPDGAYVRRFVPELAALPDAHLHAPWDAPANVLAAAGVILGKTYPDPIVDHAEARDRALAAFATVKASAAAA
jgi:deoxyribodipyrimidine photo-lyase